MSPPHRGSAQLTIACVNAAFAVPEPIGAAAVASEGAMVGVHVAVRIGPSAQGGLDEALGLAVGLGGVGLGADVLDAQPLAWFWRRRKICSRNRCRS
jgi:hypothetical protein